ncbi:MAG: hypothetical protein AB7O99_09005 [Dongiaceae bacterium]
MDLLTQLIILATALVGLYKAATFHRSRSEGDSDSKALKPKLPGMFSDLLEFGGVFLFMLAFPAFLWAFMAIMTGMQKTLKKEPIAQAKEVVQLSEGASIEEIRLAAAGAMSNSISRDDELQKIISEALAACNFTYAVKAASMISNSIEKDEELAKIVQVSPKAQCNAASAPNNSLQARRP